MRVWVVDDDLYILKLLGFMLQKNGVDHRLFESSVLAVEEAAAEIPDILITDIHLPEITGIELAENLRTTYPKAAFTIIGLTGEPETLTAHFDGYLTKPVREDELMGIVRPAVIHLPFLDAMIRNEDDRKEILRHFTDETATDLETLTDAVTTGDSETVVLLVHRLGGRLAQFSQQELSNSLREIEYNLQNGSGVSEQKTEIASVTGQIKSFLRKVAVHS